MNRRAASLLLLAALSFFAFSWARTDERALTREGLAMDTLVRLSVMGPDPDVLEGALEEGFALLSRLEGELSLYQGDSLLSRINGEAGSGRPVPVPPEIRELIGAAREIGRLTDGVFNPLIGPVTRLWKINQAQDLSFRLPSQASLDAVLPLTHLDGLEVRPEGVSLTRRGAALDLGGIAKGYASSRLAALFRARGIPSALIDLGGNIQVLGKKEGKPWAIGIRDPLHPAGVALVLSVGDTAVITSGGYERYKIVDGVRYSHFFDPRTGRPVKNGLLSATLITPDGTLADALATAFMVMGPERAMEFLRGNPGLGAVLLLEGDGGKIRILATENLRGRLTRPVGEVQFF